MADIMASPALDLEQELLRRLSLYPVITLNQAKAWRETDLVALKCQRGLHQGSMQVLIKTMTGKIFAIDTEASESIGELKSRVAEVEKIPIEQQRLIFNGRQLDDDRTLSDYDIQRGAQINLCLRLRGGMYHGTSGRSGFHPSFLLTVEGPNKTELMLQVHVGTTLLELLDLIVDTARTLGQHRHLRDCGLFLGDIPLAAENVATETLATLGITPELQVPLVLAPSSG
jgi:large subunit ribosomal protein L40e